MTNFIDIEGIKVSYEIKLTDSDIYLIFIHGLQTRKEAFEFFKNRLKNELNYCTLSIDLVGFGNSEKPDNFPYDLISQATIVKDILRALEIKNIILVGHSYGGMISTYLSNQSDLNVLALISLEGNLTKGDCGESMNVSNLSFSDFKPYYNELISKLDNTKKFAEQFRAGALKKIPDHIFYKSSKTIVDWSIKSILYELFTNLKIPKLLVIGSESGYKTKPDDEATTIKIIQNAGHFMLLEKPEDSSEKILEFLVSLPAQ